ncbi:MAG: hypothetical protein II839_04390 [Kiritimatiellae bacterium]|nr:hypothetical protein [Kiritimatiellia bacterium]
MQPAFSLPNVYSDHMVFQRGMPIEIAGTAPARSTVQVAFDGVRKSVRAGADGEWRVEFPALPAGTGHVVRAENGCGAAIELKDVAVGDVWFAGGQSNMEFPVVGSQFYGLPGGWDLAGEANDPDLRILYSQRAVSPDGPCRDLPRGACWKPATSREAVGICSAVGYLFGVLLRKRLGIPVGIVSSNWGGCRIEPWIDEATFRRHRCKAELDQIARARKLAKGGIDEATRRMKNDAERRTRLLENWLRRKFFASNPAATKAALASWAKPGLDVRGWTHGTLASLSGAKEPGVIWYRREVEIPAGWDPARVRFRADWMNDTDEVFWDGRKIGQTWIDTRSYWYAMRDYAVPAALAKPGRHVVAVRLANHFCSGGFGNVWIGAVGSDDRIPLNGGDWAERVELRPSKACGERPVAPVGAEEVDPRASMTLPSTLFNAMFAPVSPLRFKGAIWYQGESNASEWKKYGRWQKLLVECWRRATRSPDMAFLQVQLAAYERHSPDNRLPDGFWKDFGPENDQDWTAIRAVQEEIRSIRFCDLVTAADIGDHSDIHPSNKREVARRLDALAGKLVYGAKGTATGPILKAVTRKGAALRCTFAEVGSGLVVRDTPVCGLAGRKPAHGTFVPEEHAFAIAGVRGKWAWAEARLEGNAVVVSSPDVPKPARVRYAWSMYPPSMRLFNKEGFPAFPFQGKAK